VRGNANDWLSQIPFLMIGMAISLLMVGPVSAAGPSSSECGPLAIGAMDYLGDRGGQFKVVEQYHFTPKVEGLISGSTGSLGGDLGYTLSQIPNHHRALMAMMRLGEKLKTYQPYGAQYSIECWFERAIRFRPYDHTARLIYVTFLMKNGRQSAVIDQLEVAKKIAGDNPFAHYNIGLIYFDLKNYDPALAQAHIAYGLGFDRPELREKLKGIRQWKEFVETSSKPAPDVATQGAVDSAKPHVESTRLN